MKRQLGYVDTNYLDAVKVRLLRDKQYSFELLALSPGASVLEVGCGPATDTLALAELVGKNGRVIGVDHDPEMVAEANARAESAGLADVVTHQVGDASALPFPDKGFDACRSERLFQHLSDPSAALGEMARVTKPGGRIVVVDTDWGTASTDSPETDIERRLTRFYSDQLIRNGYSGRQLFRLFREARLLNVAIEPRAVPTFDLAFLRLVISLDKLEAEALEAGVVTAEELARWRAGLESADANGTLFGCGTIMVASGTKGSG